MANAKTLFGVILAQLLGAFNEYAMKLMVFTLATRSVLATGQLQATLSLAVFLIPMMLFSLPAGLLADRFSKRSLIIITKALEVGVMVATSIGLFLAPHQIFLPFAMLGLLGVIGALFNPAKGGILPEILCPQNLGKGNGIIEMWTMVAVFAGYFLGPMMLAFDGGGIYPQLTWLAPAFLAVLSLISLLFTFTIPKVNREPSAGIGIVQSLKNAFRAARNDYVLSLMLVGNVLFWVVLTYFGQNVLVETKFLVRGWSHSELWQGVPLAAFWLGIALGTLGGGRLPTDRIRKGPKLGAIAWFASIWLLFRFLHPGLWGSVAILVLLGLAAGFLIVPITALIQGRAPQAQRGSVLAFNNILNICGLLAGSFLAMQMGY